MKKTGNQDGNKYILRSKEASNYFLRAIRARVLSVRKRDAVYKQPEVVLRSIEQGLDSSGHPG